MKKFDAVIVGAGLTGLRVAIELVKHDKKVAVISKTHPMRSHSISASGGLNAALGNHPDSKGDSSDIHAGDTLSYGYGFSDEASVRSLTDHAPDAIREMERWGCLFSRMPDDKIAQRNFGASTFPRTVYSADKTGHALMNTLYEQCIRLRHNKSDHIRFFEEWLVVKCLVNQNR